MHRENDVVQRSDEAAQLRAGLVDEDERCLDVVVRLVIACVKQMLRFVAEVGDVGDREEEGVQGSRDSRDPELGVGGGATFVIGEACFLGEVQVVVLGSDLHVACPVALVQVSKDCDVSDGALRRDGHACWFLLTPRTGVWRRVVVFCRHVGEILISGFA